MRKVTKKWKMRDGTKIRICDMTDTHLHNTIAMLERFVDRLQYSYMHTGYQMLGMLQGEMAIESVENDLRRLEEEGLDPADEIPIYMDLCNEVIRRELEEIKNA